MLVLGIDTSSAVGSIAVSREGIPVVKRTISVDMEHSGNLLPSLEELLQDVGIKAQGLDAVAVGVGPGSYTGVRVGIAFAKGLAYGLKVPVVGVCSFESMLFGYSDFDGDICALEDAKMGGTYWAVYRWENSKINVVQAPKVSRTEDIEFVTSGKVLFLSPDIEKFAGPLRKNFDSHGQVEFKEAFPNAEYIAVRGELRLKDRHPGENLEPYYLRPSMAELTWSRKKQK